MGPRWIRSGQRLDSEWGVTVRPKLGIYVPTYGGWLRGVAENEEKPTFSYAAKVVSLAEEVGIDSVWVPDHMLNPIKGEAQPSLEAWTTLSALAVITRRIELFHTTLCQSFRFPAVLAKMVATIDDLSNGRFRFALGAGWFKREFEAYGVPWEEHDERIERSREQVRILKALWTQSKVNHEGRFYSIKDGILEPKPVQRPWPPMWWGGESEPSRELVADEMDGWLMRGSTVAAAEEKMADMEKRLAKRGRSRIQYAVPGMVFLGKTDDDAREAVKRTVGENATLLDNVLATGFVGSAETIADRIGKLGEIGFDYVILQITPTLKTLENLKEAVLPLL